MRILVTGSSGFLGRNIVTALLERHSAASVVGLDSEPLADGNADLASDGGGRIDHRIVDITDRRATAASAGRSAFTHVIHAAAVTHSDGREARAPASYVDVNVGGTVNVLEAFCRRRAVRVVNVSSGAVYGWGTEAGIQDESVLCAPDDLYGITKLAAEEIGSRYASLFGFHIVHVRLSNVFGPLERRTATRPNMSVPCRLVEAAVAPRPVTITRRSWDAGRDYLSVTDAAAAITKLLTADVPASGALNVASGCATKTRYLVSAVRQLVPGLSVTLTDEPGEADIDVDPMLTRGRFAPYSIARLRDQIDWSPSPLRAELARYVEWATRRDCPHSGSRRSQPATTWPGSMNERGRGERGEPE